MTTGTELAARFERANQEFIAVIEGLSPSDWKAICVAEGWTVGVTAHHVGAGYDSMSKFIQALVSGTAPPVTWEVIDEANALHAEEYAAVTSEETLEVLRNGSANVTAWLASLEPADLKQTVVLPIMGDEPISVQTIIEAVVIGHIGIHQSSIEAAVR